MRLIRFCVAALAWLGFAGGIAYFIALRFVGESAWPTTVLLYLPHGLLVVPVLLVGVLLACFGPRRLLVVWLATLILLLFPIMGLAVGGPAIPSGSPRLRLLTYNVDNGQRSIDAIVRQITEAAPDVVVLQESAPAVNDAVTAALPGFFFHRSWQFFLASRFPIADVHDPAKVVLRGVDRSPRFMAYTLDTPLGPLDLFSVHPISPREGFNDLRGDGIRHELETGRLFAGDGHTLVANTELRRLQVHAIAEAAGRSAHPFIIAGDTNLPAESHILADELGGFQDGFAEVGRGFGYTFPAHKYRPWMRIDRILAGAGLRFIDIDVGELRGSDHLCVYADIEKR